MGRESEVVSAEEQPEATGDERAEIELRRRLVREAKIANMRAGGRGDLSPDELDAVIPPTRLLAGEAAAGEYRSWRRTLMVSRNVLTLHFGALAYPLAKQLRGHRLPRELVNLWQEDADAITRLHVRGIITEDEASRARDRLAHAITDRMGGDWRELP